MIRHTGLRAIRKFSTYRSLLFDVLKSPILIWVAAAGNFFLAVGAAGFFLVERGTNSQVATMFDAVWWAFSTVTTVGFGDVVPVTTAGRLIGIALMIIGVTTFVSFTALLVTITSARAAEEIVGFEVRESRALSRIAEALEAVEARLEKIESNR